MNMQYEVLIQRLYQESKKYNFAFCQQGEKVVVRFHWKGKSFPLLITSDTEGNIHFFSKSGKELEFSDCFDAHRAFWGIWKKLKAKK